jgi:two-component system LytT family sensor kinase
VQLTAERLEMENLQTRFLALKNQLSPHFLFNSLSILTSLIEKNPQQSVTYVNRLSKTYRYILEHAGDETVTLRTELDFITSYIFLLKSRFEEKLEVSIDISPECRQQSRIAVKHNQMSQEVPLHISIQSPGMYLLVSNAIHKRREQSTSTKIGLQNVIRRYGLLTPEPVVVSDENGVFTVKIPLLP